MRNSETLPADRSGVGKEHILSAVAALTDRLIGMADQIHAHAELKFEEHRSAAVLMHFLEQQEFVVEKGPAGLETAFIAHYGRGEPNLALLAEYDALAGLGHGCGHNLIGPASVGAAVALKERLRDEGLPGTVMVIGTPGEEGGAGKVLMADRGVFENVDFVMMVHAFNRTVLDYGTIAAVMITVEYHGRASHASVEPEKGLNALDAAIGLFHGVNALRQQVSQDIRMHGIIAEGGTAPNVIPNYTRCEWLLRAETLEKLEWLTGRFRDCAERAGRMAGCQTEFTLHHRYKPRVPNQTMLKLFGDNLSAMDVAIDPPPETGRRGSSDMGDVSWVVPTIQCYIRIAEDHVPWHSPEVVALSRSDVGYSMLIAGAKALAMTGYDILTSPKCQHAIKLEFQELVSSKYGRQ